MNERILVTGASGFVGLPLVAELARRGCQVVALAHRSAGPDISNVTWIHADLLDSTSIRPLFDEIQPTHLVHAAWYVEHGKFWTAPENKIWVEASFELAARFFQAGGRRFVGLGTCAEYARHDANDDQPWSERRKIDPETPYGLAKAGLARRLFEMAEHRSGAHVAWARIFHLFGPNEHPARLVSSLARALIAGEEARCGSGRPVRDFASTWHLAEALATLALSEIVGPVNGGTGVPLSITDLAIKLARLAGRPDLLRFGALADKTDEVPFMVADTSRLRLEAGYAGDVAIERDLCRLLAWLRSSEPNNA